MNEPIRASLILPGTSPEEVFSALSKVERLPDWALGLKEARKLDALGGMTGDLTSGSSLEFILSAAGITHRVSSTITLVDPPCLVEWRYDKGATDAGKCNI